jgi:hypothetical protein
MRGLYCWPLLPRKLTSDFPSCEEVFLIPTMSIIPSIPSNYSNHQQTISILCLCTASAQVRAAEGSASRLDSSLSSLTWKIKSIVEDCRGPWLSNLLLEISESRLLLMEAWWSLDSLKRTIQNLQFWMLWCWDPSKRDFLTGPLKNKEGPGTSWNFDTCSWMFMNCATVWVSDVSGEMLTFFSCWMPQTI